MKYIILVICGIFFVACSVNNMELKKDSKLILLKSKDINFNDIGILSFGNEITLELFNSGKKIGKFIIKDDEICFFNDCTTKYKASKAFFGDIGYENLFEEILSKKDIFGSRGKSIDSNGEVTQKIKINNNEILYKHSKDSIVFKNFTNKMTIIINDLNY